MAHAHPLLASTGLLLALGALRLGLSLRRKRRLSLRRDPAERRSHLRIAKPAVVLIVLAGFGGPLSSVFLRGWTPFERLHGWVGLFAAGLFLATAILGRRIELGRSRAFDRHALLGLAAVAAGALALGTGFVLLP